MTDLVTSGVALLLLDTKTWQVDALAQKSLGAMEQVVQQGRQGAIAEQQALADANEASFKRNRLC